MTRNEHDNIYTKKFYTYGMGNKQGKGLSKNTDTNKQCTRRNLGYNYLVLLCY